MTNEIHRYICSDNIDKNYTESKFSESLFSSDCGYEEMRDLSINDLITHPKSLS